MPPQRHLSAKVVQSLMVVSPTLASAVLGLSVMNSTVPWCRPRSAPGCSGRFWIRRGSRFAASWGDSPRSLGSRTGLMAPGFFSSCPHTLFQ